MDGMGWDGMGWMDGISKVSFKFLYTLWVYSACIYLLIYIYSKIVTKFLWVSKFHVKLGAGVKIFKIIR